MSVIEQFTLPKGELFGTWSLHKQIITGFTSSVITTHYSMRKAVLSFESLASRVNGGYYFWALGHTSSRKLVTLNALDIPCELHRR